MADVPLDAHDLDRWSLMEARHRRLLLLLWAVFLLRGIFYISFTPLWEGFDEHSHFAYVQLLSTEARLPVADRDRVSEEIHSSLKLAPLPAEPRGFGLGLIHDQYWKLDKEERHRREAGLRALDPALGRRQIPKGESRSNVFLSIYEAQHPPLYYFLCLAPYRLAAQLNLIDRVFLIRAFSILLASGLIPLGFMLLRQLLGDTQALLVLWIVAFLPGVMFDVARVGNDSLAALLFTLLVCLSVRTVVSRTQALAIGLTLGLGLLTKTSFLTAVVPFAIALLLPRVALRPLRSRIVDLGVAGLAVTAVAAWWYWLNYSTTGSWTGLYFDSLTPRWSLTKTALSVDWANASDAILRSHVWFGNWSFLALRGWMYQLVTVVFAVAAAGVGIRVVHSFKPAAENRYPFLVAVLFYAFFWLGLGYYVLLTYAATGVSAIPGWYLCTPIACEILLLYVGWTLFFPRTGRVRVAAAMALGATLMDLYGVFFLLIPYYTGFISRNARGSMSSFRPWTVSLADYAEMFSRLTVNKSGFMTAGYFLVTASVFLVMGIASVALALRFLWRVKAGE
ncbi:MAG: hypothetical protein EHM61_05425 [Acidobacteria bacterium]|nr:MAG: hypothetical protein EHM61_05425 [Acidobacteriota bacterium]